MNLQLFAMSVVLLIFVSIIENADATPPHLAVFCARVAQTICLVFADLAGWAARLARLSNLGSWSWKWLK